MNLTEQNTKTVFPDSQTEPLKQGGGLHIAVAGNIGSGKSTLTEMLSRHYGWKAQMEAVMKNPYMDDYYKDLKRWSFPMEVFFLKERFRDVLQICQSEETIVQDRSIFEGVYVFTANNYKQGNLIDKDYETYMELFDIMMSQVRMPDLMIYLRASVPHLVANIQKRGRNYEQQIPIDYLEGLNHQYDDFIYNKYQGRVLTIEVDNLDYQHRPADFKFITEQIEQSFNTSSTPLIK